MRFNMVGLLAFLFMFIMPSTPAHSGEAALPIRVGLISCGKTKADIPLACKADQRCCAFIDQAPKIERLAMETKRSTLPTRKPEAARPASFTPLE